VGIRARVLRLEREAEEELVSVHLRDGRSARFGEEEIFPECFLHEYDRGKRAFDGEDPGPAHPFVEALRGASDEELQRLASEQGTMILMFLGEDEVIRGERERTGAPVRGTSPGAYE
jgi:hypothetical protein